MRTPSCRGAGQPRAQARSWAQRSRRGSKERHKFIPRRVEEARRRNSRRGLRSNSAARRRRAARTDRRRERRTIDRAYSLSPPPVVVPARRRNEHRRTAALANGTEGDYAEWYLHDQAGNTPVSAPTRATAPVAGLRIDTLNARGVNAVGKRQDRKLGAGGKYNRALSRNQGEHLAERV